MGRKTRRIQPKPRVRPRLETRFNCPICTNEKSIEVVIQRNKRIAALRCKTCSVSYRTTISALDEAVDVFSYWLDLNDNPILENHELSDNEEILRIGDALHDGESRITGNWQNTSVDDKHDHEKRFCTMGVREESPKRKDGDEALRVTSRGSSAIDTIISHSVHHKKEPISEKCVANIDGCYDSWDDD